VAFIEQFDADRFDGLEPPVVDAGRMDARGLRGHLPADFEPWANLTASEQWSQPGQRWIFMSDVCKHCVDAPCLEACPTGSIIRTEFDTVFVQQDICNGCGYCQPACPFGVVEVDRQGDGKAHKCTLCYDRLRDGLEPACAKACPTDSIVFGPVDELLGRARERVADLRGRGVPAYLYGTDGMLEDQCDTSRLEGLNCFFLLIDQPEVYNLPAVPKRPSSRTGSGLLAVAAAALALTAGTLAAFRDH
jgi:formate dehydrogenase iron-sulfur subunit